ncbi:hypothetical protein [Bdellovibrio bacteriovorus]|uniref:hypothetical protein n=1 Tax=Bdellovibrio bacteriovorus TaxID=959 RepID=UPI003AA8771B
MKWKAFTAFAATSLIAAWAHAKAPTTKAEFCEMAHKPATMRALLADTENQLSFTNHGGLGDAGVCWWHSMFTRNANYLTIYRPEEPRPNRNEVRQIIMDISANRGVVEIPGFKNLSEFSYAHGTEIQQALEEGQIVDGGLMFGWIRGVTGNHTIPAAEMKKRMDELYAEVSKGIIPYQMLQIEGITAHAWLVVDMKRTANGYILTVHDSNYKGTYNVVYSDGMTQLSDYQAVPYTSRNMMDYASYETALKNFCKRGFTAKDLRASRSKR